MACSNVSAIATKHTIKSSVNWGFLATERSRLRTSGQHVWQRGRRVRDLLNVEELGAGQSLRGELLLGVAALVQVPGRVQEAHAAASRALRERLGLFRGQQRRQGTGPARGGARGPAHGLEQRGRAAGKGEHAAEVSAIQSASQQRSEMQI